MILYVDIPSGEVRDPAIGVVGKIIAAKSGGWPPERVAIELDLDKVAQRVKELRKRGGVF